MPYLAARVPSPRADIIKRPSHEYAGASGRARIKLSPLDEG
jgi:hypothetical protein